MTEEAGRDLVESPYILIEIIDRYEPDNLLEAAKLLARQKAYDRGAISTQAKAISLLNDRRGFKAMVTYHKFNEEEQERLEILTKNSPEEYEDISGIQRGKLTVATSLIKRCRICDSLKSPDGFYTHNENRDGLQTACIQCMTEEASRRLLGYDFVEFCKRHNPTSLSEALEMGAKREARALELTRRYQKEKAIRKPEQDIAKKKIARAIRGGKLTRGSCMICGSTDNIQAHHPDYTRPLHVEWLCPSHHRIKHIEADEAIPLEEREKIIKNINERLVREKDPANKKIWAQIHAKIATRRNAARKRASLWLPTTAKKQAFKE